MKVIDFAVRMERRGRDFFKDLARHAEEPGVRGVFTRMAEDEEQMLRTIRSLNSPDVESAALDGLKNVFDGKMEEGREVRRPLDAYLFLMEVEREVCRLYEEALRHEKDPRARRLLRRIAAAEERELRSLEEVYDFINAPNEYLAWQEFSNLDEFHNFGRYEDNRGCGHTLH